VSVSGYVVRAAGPSDLEGFKQLREIAGAGFTSLMLDDKALAQKLALSQQSFAADVSAPGSERYFLALEHLESGAVVGCAGVKATIGKLPPFFNFRIITEAQFSGVVERRFDMDILIGVNDFTGCSEVGSLFVRPEHRAGGIGRTLAQSRYLLMATSPHRFNARFRTARRCFPRWDLAVLGSGGAAFLPHGFRRSRQTLGDHRQPVHSRPHAAASDLHRFAAPSGA
jgi:arginine N-succinyltransferase